MRCLEEFGAIGDGVKYDSAAISSAIAYGDRVLAKSGAVYVIDSSITIQGKSISIEGDRHKPAKFLFKGNSFLKLMGNPLNNTLLKTNTTANDSYVEVVSVTGFVVGNLITVTTPEVNSWGYDPISNDYRNGEIHRIVRIDGNKIYTHDKIWHNWDASKSIKVQQYSPITVNISNVIFEYETPQAANILQIIYSLNSTINAQIINSKTTGISISYAYNTKVDGCIIDGCNSSTAGYGIRVQSSSFTYVGRNIFYNTFKCIESSTMQGVADYGQFPNRNMIVDINFATGNGVLDNGATIFDSGGRFVNTHAPSENILVCNNIVNNYHTFLTAAGIDISAKENKISGKMVYAFMLMYGQDYHISDNTVRGYIQNAFIYLFGNKPNINATVNDNVINRMNKIFILNENVGDISGLSVSDNDMTFADANPTMYSKTLISTNDVNNYIRS